MALLNTIGSKRSPTRKNFSTGSRLGGNKKSNSTRKVKEARVGLAIKSWMRRFHDNRGWHDDRCRGYDFSPAMAMDDEASAGD